MEEQKFSFSESFKKSKEYLDTQFELLKLQAISRMTRIMGSLIVDASKLLLTLLVIFFWSLALGFYLGEVLGSYSLGFLATGGIFLIIILLIRVFEPKLEAKFMNLSIKRILAKWDDPDDEEEEEKLNTDTAYASTNTTDNAQETAEEKLAEEELKQEQEEKERV
ncbi:hypothetical protein [Sphingobacterium hotanense]|uniref:Superfamily III holin-X n=1 Tax=Sphingobacterium hotanense TaxID=649196 RepID=A0ABT7NM41_9SPHI|nr:hypothetical protein [Sphingobacterium hotanense]MCT1525976.1 hypothetical protein [Sphingobacterium hotanense]MDM1048325.1 hypothetical protein [Sphingobacterium hotanense]